MAKVWGPHQHLFPTPLPIAAAVGLWVSEHGLPEPHARAILAGMTRPENMARFKFASDLMTHLAEQARDVIADAARSEVAKREADYAAERDKPLGDDDRQKVLSMLANRFTIQPAHGD